MVFQAKHDGPSQRNAANATPTRVLGIDPGTRQLGWAVVSSEGTRLVAIGYGVLRARANLPVPERLRILAQGLRRLVVEHQPEAAALEEAFYGRDPRAAQRIGEARGAIHLVLAEAGVPTMGYANNVVKKAVTGNGRATKSQVESMVERILHLPEAVGSFDAADALALAICRLQRGAWTASVGGLPARIEAAIARDAQRRRGGRKLPATSPAVPPPSRRSAAASETGQAVEHQHQTEERQSEERMASPSAGPLPPRAPAEPPH